MSKVKNNNFMAKENKTITKKSWKEFRETGLFWWINMILHTFGWALIMEFNNDNEIVECYPARVKFRGFNEEQNTKGYNMVSEYISKNADKLLLESLEEM